MSTTAPPPAAPWKLPGLHDEALDEYEPDAQASVPKKIVIVGLVDKRFREGPLKGGRAASRTVWERAWADLDDYLRDMRIRASLDQARIELKQAWREAYDQLTAASKAKDDELAKLRDGIGKVLGDRLDLLRTNVAGQTVILEEYGLTQACTLGQNINAVVKSDLDGARPKLATDDDRQKAEKALERLLASSAALRLADYARAKIGDALPFEAKVGRVVEIEKAQDALSSAMHAVEWEEPFTPEGAEKFNELFYLGWRLDKTVARLLSADGSLVGDLVPDEVFLRALVYRNTVPILLRAERQKLVGVGHPKVRHIEQDLLPPFLLDAVSTIGAACSSSFDESALASAKAEGKTTFCIDVHEARILNPVAKVREYLKTREVTLKGKDGKDYKEKDDFPIRGRPYRLGWQQKKRGAEREEFLKTYKEEWEKSEKARVEKQKKEAKALGLEKRGGPFLLLKGDVYDKASAAAEEAAKEAEKPRDPKAPAPRPGDVEVPRFEKVSFTIALEIEPSFHAIKDIACRLGTYIAAKVHAKRAGEEKAAETGELDAERKGATAAATNGKEPDTWAKRIERKYVELKKRLGIEIETDFEADYDEERFEVALKVKKLAAAKAGEKPDPKAAPAHHLELRYDVTGLFKGFSLDQLQSVSLDFGGEFWGGALKYEGQTYGEATPAKEEAKKKKEAEGGGEGEKGPAAPLAGGGGDLQALPSVVTDALLQKIQQAIPESVGKTFHDLVDPSSTAAFGWNKSIVTFEGHLLLKVTEQTRLIADLYVHFDIFNFISPKLVRLYDQLSAVAQDPKKIISALQEIAGSDDEEASKFSAWLFQKIQPIIDRIRAKIKALEPDVVVHPTHCHEGLKLTSFLSIDLRNRWVVIGSEAKKQLFLTFYGHVKGRFTWCVSFDLNDAEVSWKELFIPDEYCVEYASEGGGSHVSLVYEPKRAVFRKLPEGKKYLFRTDKAPAKAPPPAADDAKDAKDAKEEKLPSEKAKPDDEAKPEIEESDTVDLTGAFSVKALEEKVKSTFLPDFVTDPVLHALRAVTGHVVAAEQATGDAKKTYFPDDKAGLHVAVALEFFEVLRPSPDAKPEAPAPGGEPAAEKKDPEADAKKDALTKFAEKIPDYRAIVRLEMLIPGAGKNGELGAKGGRGALLFEIQISVSTVIISFLSKILQDIAKNPLNLLDRLKTPLKMCGATGGMIGRLVAKLPTFRMDMIDIAFEKGLLIFGVKSPIIFNVGWDLKAANWKELVLPVRYELGYKFEAGIEPRITYRYHRLRPPEDLTDPEKVKTLTRERAQLLMPHIFPNVEELARIGGEDKEEKRRQWVKVHEAELLPPDYEAREKFFDLKKDDGHPTLAEAERAFARHKALVALGNDPDRPIAKVGEDPKAFQKRFDDWERTRAPVFSQPWRDWMWIEGRAGDKLQYYDATKDTGAFNLIDPRNPGDKERTPFPRYPLAVWGAADLPEFFQTYMIQPLRRLDPDFQLPVLMVVADFGKLSSSPPIVWVALGCVIIQVDMVHSLVLSVKVDLIPLIKWLVMKVAPKLLGAVPVIGQIITAAMVAYDVYCYLERMGAIDKAGELSAKLGESLMKSFEQLAAELDKLMKEGFAAADGAIFQITASDSQKADKAAEDRAAKMAGEWAKMDEAQRRQFEAVCVDRILMGLSMRFIDGYQGAMLLLPYWVQRRWEKLLWREEFNDVAGKVIQKYFPEGFYKTLDMIGDNAWMDPRRRQAIEKDLKENRLTAADYTFLKYMGYPKSEYSEAELHGAIATILGDKDTQKTRAVLLADELEREWRACHGQGETHSVSARAFGALTVEIADMRKRKEQYEKETARLNGEYAKAREKFLATPPDPDDAPAAAQPPVGPDGKKPEPILPAHIAELNSSAENFKHLADGIDFEIRRTQFWLDGAVIGDSSRGGWFAGSSTRVATAMQVPPWLQMDAAQQARWKDAHTYNLANADEIRKHGGTVNPAAGAGRATALTSYETPNQRRREFVVGRIANAGLKPEVVPEWEYRLYLAAYGSMDAAANEKAQKAGDKDRPSGTDAAKKFADGFGAEKISAEIAAAQKIAGAAFPKELGFFYQALLDGLAPGTAPVEKALKDALAATVPVGRLLAHVKEQGGDAFAKEVTKDNPEGKVAQKRLADLYFKKSEKPGDSVTQVRVWMQWLEEARSAATKALFAEHAEKEKSAKDEKAKAEEKIGKGEAKEADYAAAAKAVAKPGKLRAEILHYDLYRRVALREWFGRTHLTAGWSAVTDNAYRNLFLECGVLAFNQVLQELKALGADAEVKDTALFKRLALLGKLLASRPALEPVGKEVARQTANRYDPKEIKEMPDEVMYRLLLERIESKESPEKHAKILELLQSLCPKEKEAGDAKRFNSAIQWLASRNLLVGGMRCSDDPSVTQVYVSEGLYLDLCWNEPRKALPSKPGEKPPPPPPVDDKSRRALIDLIVANGTTETQRLFLEQLLVGHRIFRFDPKVVQPQATDSSGLAAYGAYWKPVEYGGKLFPRNPDAALALFIHDGICTYLDRLIEPKKPAAPATPPAKGAPPPVPEPTRLETLFPELDVRAPGGAADDGLGETTIGSDSVAQWTANLGRRLLPTDGNTLAGTLKYVDLPDRFIIPTQDETRAERDLTMVVHWALPRSDVNLLGKLVEWLSQEYPAFLRVEVVIDGANRGFRQPIVAGNGTVVGTSLVNGGPLNPFCFGYSSNEQYAGYLAAGVARGEIKGDKASTPVPAGGVLRPYVNGLLAEVPGRLGGLLADAVPRLPYGGDRFFVSIPILDGEDPASLPSAEKGRRTHALRTYLSITDYSRAGMSLRIRPRLWLGKGNAAVCIAGKPAPTLRLVPPDCTQIQHADGPWAKWQDRRGHGGNSVTLLWPKTVKWDEPENRGKFSAEDGYPKYVTRDYAYKYWVLLTRSPKGIQHTGRWNDHDDGEIANEISRRTGDLLLLWQVDRPMTPFLWRELEAKLTVTLWFEESGLGTLQYTANVGANRACKWDVLNAPSESRGAGIFDPSHPPVLGKGGFQNAGLIEDFGGDGRTFVLTVPENQWLAFLGTWLARDAKSLEKGEQPLARPNLEFALEFYDESGTRKLVWSSHREVQVQKVAYWWWP